MTSVSGPFCAGCGRAPDACSGCRRPLDPPRFCPACGARLTVWVTPTRVRARCAAHGSIEVPTSPAAP